MCIMYTKAGTREVIYEGLGVQYREFQVERLVVLLQHQNECQKGLTIYKAWDTYSLLERFVVLTST
jgi:hypothetical protein